jgi:predicted aspartyl protease
LAGSGEPLNFLLDSGAGASVLDLTVARRLGLELGESQNVQGCTAAPWLIV